MSLTSNQEAGDSYIQPEKKTRKRVGGRWCGLSATFIASLAGVAPVTARRFLYSYGKAKSNTLTIEDLRRWIFTQEANKFVQDIRKIGAIDIANDLTDLVQQRQPR